jgi:hypothetical protein
MMREFRRFDQNERKLADDAVRPMCVAVFGPSQVGKSHLISALARRRITTADRDLRRASKTTTPSEPASSAPFSRWCCARNGRIGWRRPDTSSNGAEIVHDPFRKINRLYPTRLR